LKKIRVGVVFGGRSGEHEVSLVSAQSVMSALDPSKYEVVPIGITREGKWLADGNPMQYLQDVARNAGRLLAPGAGADSPLKAGADSAPTRHLTPLKSPLAALGNGAARLDVVFPVLHGPYGEDGTIQGLLEMADIPYVGAGVLGSALGMDKVVQKTLLRANGIPVVNWVTCLRKEWQRDPQQVITRVETELGYPCFTKPANLGSSVGISRARNRQELISGLDAAATHDRKLLVEQAAMDCREVECSVLGNDSPIASLPGEVRPRREFYDYTAKYVTDDTDLIIPASLPDAITEQVRRLAVASFLAIDCAGMARVDFFVRRDYSIVYVNELNTIPGFTAISMYPKLWAATGLSYPDLLDRLIALALERHKERHRTDNGA
jgi:D-alanine-D-alanine ligase